MTAARRSAAARHGGEALHAYERGLPEPVAVARAGCRQPALPERGVIAPAQTDAGASGLGELVDLRQLERTQSVAAGGRQAEQQRGGKRG